MSISFEAERAESRRQAVTMKMKGFFILLVDLVFTSAFFINRPEQDIVDIGQNKDISDALLLDDVMKPPFTPRSTISFEDKLWTSPVPYELDMGLDMNAKGVILKAFEQIRIKSCIDFKPRDSEDFYLSFKKLDGCFSYVGREHLNGQNLSIGTGCDSLSTVEHEVLHALGFNHEHCRSDRDDYVQIDEGSILEGLEYNFAVIGSENSTTHETPYDYWSVMHYPKNAFSNGSASTITTIDPKYQDLIGQRLDLSPGDAIELNLLYNCSSTVAFMFYCGFSNGTMCEMNQSGSGWEVVTQVSGGPTTDHTSLPSGNGEHGQEEGYFIHVNTSGQEEDPGVLMTQIMRPKRECKVQCLQFYYYYTGNESDSLNIGIREFEDEQNTTGTFRLMGHITGRPTSYWKVHHVSLNATKNFQVVFEIKKAENSSGGFSIDDINLSETECPHVIMQIDEFENVLNTSKSGERLYSPRLYSKDGYAYRLAVVLNKTYVGMFVQLVSGVNDDQLEWPCVHRQMTFQLLDQTPNMQQQMSQRWTFTTEQNDEDANDTLIWNHPNETGTTFLYNNTELVRTGFLWGFLRFAALEEMQYRDFLRGGSAVFMFSFDDLTPLVNGSILPCPEVRPVTSLHLSFLPTIYSKDLNSTGSFSTVSPPPTTDNCRNSSCISPPPPTENSNFSTISPSPTTTDDRNSPSITPHPATNIRNTSGTAPPAATTDNRKNSSIISPPPASNDRSFSTVSPPPTTDNCRNSSCISPPPPTENSNFSTISPSPTTTDDRNSPSITPHPATNIRNTSGTAPPAATTDNRKNSSIISPPPASNDRSFSTVSPPPTTDNCRNSSCISPPPPTENSNFSTISPSPTTTDDSITPHPATNIRNSSGTAPPAATTDNRKNSSIISPTPTSNDRIFSFSPGVSASPVLVLLGLMLLVP
ncbi:meprin A subunit beta isoform X2 [Nothobranchius furzeri]|uniref:meprin A subunit beta isoform X2 n=1 Tax=Nothobranchius furzeri TaxID=105023 RepID=UPI003904BC48